MLFEVDGYLDSLTRAHENTGRIIVYSNYPPCNEAYHCCVQKINYFLLKYPKVALLCLCFSQLHHAEDSFTTAAWALPSSVEPFQPASGDTAPTAGGGRGVTSFPVSSTASLGQRFISQLHHQEPQQINIIHIKSTT